MKGAKIVLVEDDVDVREMLSFSLKRQKYQVIETASAAEAIAYLEGKSLPDLLIVDWMMPGMSGPELVSHLREQNKTAAIPIIMLTAKGSEVDKLKGFSEGVDDYIVKPFSTKELVARIAALLRRSGAGDEEVLVAGDMVLDIAAHRLSIGGDTVKIGPTEYRLVEYFLRNQDKVFSRSHLLDRIWGVNIYVEERTVDVHILRLRKILAPFGYDRLVQTVRGAGYRLLPGLPEVS